jgi:hypothetical protein
MREDEDSFELFSDILKYDLEGIRFPSLNVRYRVEDLFGPEKEVFRVVIAVVVTLKSDLELGGRFLMK